jgi:hypothetical protein
VIDFSIPKRHFTLLTLENENLAKGLNLIMAAIGGLPVGSDFQN